MKRKTLLLLIGILLIGSVLRIVGLGFGIGHFTAPDEGGKRKTVMNLEKMKFIPGFRQPSFLPYSSYLFTKAYFGIADLFTQTKEHTPEEYHYAIRLWMALLGIMTLIILFIMVRRFFDEKTALLSTFFLSIVPLHVAVSHYIKEDIPVTLMCCIVLFFSLQIIRHGRWFDYACAGFFSGIAFFSKYNGLLVLFCVGLAHILRISAQHKGWKNFLKELFNYRIFLVPLFFIAGLIVTCPPVLVKFPEIWKKFMWQLSYGRSGHTDGLAILAGDHWFSFYLLRALLPGLTIGILSFALTGLFLFFYPSKTSREKILIGSWIVFFYIAMELSKAKPYPFFARYMTPILPPLCLAGASGFFFLKEQLVRIHSLWGKRLLFSVLLLLCLYPLYFSTRFVLAMKNDTRLTSRTWLEENIPEKAHITIWKSRNYHPKIDIEKYHLSKEIITKYNIRDIQQPHYFIYSPFAEDRFLDNKSEAGENYWIFKDLITNNEMIQEFENFTTYGHNNPSIRFFHVQPLDATLSVKDPPEKFSPGETITLSVQCTNPDKVFQYALSFRLYIKNSDGEPAEEKLPPWKTLILKPGAAVRVPYALKIPEKKGSYVLIGEKIDKHSFYYSKHPDMHSITGQDELGKENGINMYSAVAKERRDGPGFLIYGPYVTLPEGEYTARFLLKGCVSSFKKLGFVDIYNSSKDMVLVDKRLMGKDLSCHKWTQVDLPFQSTGTEKFEFRVFYFGRGTMKFDSVLLFGPDNYMKEETDMKRFYQKIIKNN